MPITIPSLGKLKAYVDRNCDIAIHRMGAVLFTRNGHVLGYSCNRRGNGYVSEFSYHCEEMVLNKTEYQRNQRPKEKFYILVVRFLRSGEYGLAAPCGPCREMCKEAGVGVFYTTASGINYL